MILLAIKAIFIKGASRGELDDNEGILLENTNGKLLVSKDTLDNLTIATARTFEDVENVTARTTLDKEKNLIVFVSLLVKSDASIKTMSIGMQEKIKEIIKSSLDIDVKEVNVRIKNITHSKKAQEGETVK
jgi:uncharacterized alkaline shock family protein YloU